MIQNNSYSWIELNKRIITEEIANLKANTDEETEELLINLLDAVVEFVSDIKYPLSVEDALKVKEITSKIFDLNLILKKYI